MELKINEHARGFTLIEILVVIAVISVIMTITIPAYLHSRQKADQVRCVSNLRQLGMAFLAYAQDFDGYLPPYTNLLPEDFPDWLELQVEGVTCVGYPDYRVLRTAMDPYTKSKGVWFCPTDPYAGMDVYRWRVRHAGSSYIFRLYWPISMSSVKGTVDQRSVPSQTKIVLDSNIYVSTPVKAKLPSDCGRGCEHFKGTNELYLDGHVEWYRW